jgi:hypothetical protein
VVCFTFSPDPSLTFSLWFHSELIRIATAGSAAVSCSAWRGLLWPWHLAFGLRSQCGTSSGQNNVLCPMCRRQKRASLTFSTTHTPHTQHHATNFAGHSHQPSSAITVQQTQRKVYGELLQIIMRAPIRTVIAVVMLKSLPVVSSRAVHIALRSPSLHRGRHLAACTFIYPSLTECTSSVTQSRCLRRPTRAFSASININTESVSPKALLTSNPNALHTVMVHRNKQSLAFREGTPLVFTKSIAATYTEVVGIEGGDG